MMERAKIRGSIVAGRGRHRALLSLPQLF